MTILTMRRAWTLACVVSVALIAFAAAQAASPEVFTGDGPKVPAVLRLAQPRFLVTRGFYETHLAPRMAADPRGDDVFVTARFGAPASNLWTSDPAVVALVEKRTIRSIAAAFKGYAIEQLGIDRWSFPVRGGNGGATPTGQSRGVRFHLGFSRMAPRADLLVPVAAGRVALSVDARGDLRVTFDPNSSRFRLAADIDVPEHTATVRLRVQF